MGKHSITNYFGLVGSAEDGVSRRKPAANPAAGGESLEEHDRQYHPGGFDPQKHTCEKREKMAKQDDPVLSPAPEAKPEPSVQKPDEYLEYDGKTIPLSEMKLGTPLRMAFDSLKYRNGNRAKAIYEWKQDIERNEDWGMDTSKLREVVKILQSGANAVAKPVERERSIPLQKRISQSEWNAVKKHFGVTTNPANMAYIIPDGSGIDFSAGRGGGRVLDHRNISEVIERTPTRNTSHQALADVVLSGGIRYIPEGNGLELGMKPTLAQYDTLYDVWDAMQRNGDDIHIDLCSDGDLADTVSVSYSPRTALSRARSDIDDFFDNGRIPEGTASAEAMDEKISSYLTMVSDESLEAHDKKYHGGHFDPNTMKCKKRDGQNSRDKADGDIPMSAGSISGSDDAAYADAVKRGDRETALRMVREAAAKAWPDTKVVDKDGLPKVVFHGTAAAFTSFNPEQRKGVCASTWFAEDERVAEDYSKYGDGKPRVIRAFVNVTNPYNLREIGFDGGAEVNDDREDGGQASASEINLAAQISGMTPDDIHSQFYGQSLWTVTQSPQMARHAQNLGHDGILLSEYGDKTVGIFNPSQAKSADIEYDDAGNLIPLSRRFDGGADLRGDVGSTSSEPAEDLSTLSTEELDARYMKAVDDNDLNICSKLVHEAASRAMPNTKVVGADGKPRVVYHGTAPHNKFTVFDLSSSNSHKMEHVPDGTAWFTSSHETAEGYDADWDLPNIYACYLNIENPAVADAKGAHFKDDDWAFGDIKSGKGFSTGNFVRRAKSGGKDGVIIKNIIDCADSDDFVGDDYVAFRANQIKSAAPITRDDEGNVIPLSKRFNFDSEDIRDEATGKILDYLEMTDTQDVSLKEHDEQFHNGHFDPQTMTCEFRERRAALDPVDADIDENVGIGGIFTGGSASYSRPSLLHVGSGEGTQVYGWGLYGSNQRGVAEGYAVGGPSDHTVVMVDGKEWVPSKDASVGEKTAYEQLDDLSNSPSEIAEFCDSQESERYKEAAKFIRSHQIEIRDPHNYVYEQTFFTNRPKGDDSHLLKWYDKVDPEVMKRVEKLYRQETDTSLWARYPGGGVMYESDFGDDHAGFVQAQRENRREVSTNEDLYRYLSSRMMGGPKAASEFLVRADIDGIKYPVDSFGAKEKKDGDKAGWNYVSFRDDNIRVNRKFADGEEVPVKDAAIPGTDNLPSDGKKRATGVPTPLSEHDRRYHGGHYTGGPCKRREQSASDDTPDLTMTASASRSRGVPYKGSKNTVADEIVSRIPSADRFVDLMAGGGSVSHAALLSGRFGSVLANDIDIRGLRVMQDAIAGNIDQYRRLPTREEFATMRKTNDPRTRMFSFNADGRSFMGERAQPSLDMRVRRLETLKGLKGDFTVTNRDYRQVMDTLTDRDVAFADIPYPETDHRYQGAFDENAFFDRAAQSPCPVFVTAYRAPDGWKQVWEGKRRLRWKDTEKMFVQDRFADRVRHPSSEEEYLGLGQQAK